jgi:predicted transposase/invertase (TIGR01784 family)
MQLLAHRYFRDRVLYYWSRLYQQQLREGQDYDVLRPTISICFVNAVLFKDAPGHHKTFHLLDPVQGLTWTDHLVIHLLELPRFRNGPDQLADDQDRWLFFLRHGADLDTAALPPGLDRPPLRRALEELQMMAQNETARQQYESRLKMQLDRASGLRAALETGETLGRIRQCQRLLKIPLITADECSQLTPEEQQQLVSELEQRLASRLEGPG